MRYYKAEALALSGIKETYLIISATIGGAEDKTYELFKMRHPKKDIRKDIISVDVTPMVIHGIIY
jgi:hypothetical protein